MTTKPKAKTPTKLDALEKLLMRANGTTIADMMKATGWQQHSVDSTSADIQLVPFAPVPFAVGEPVDFVN